MGGKPRTRAEAGRLWFPGNPWPEGHALAELEWSLRIEPDETLWFDLHAVTRSYADEYPESLADECESDSSWDSPMVWLNYHQTSISSTKWRDDAGFQVATLAQPLAFATLAKRTFEVDPVDVAADLDDDDFAFHIYCLGHDAVAAHQISLAPRPDGRFDLSWSGLHANAYVGDYEYKNPFRLRGVVAPPIAYAPRLDRAAARRLLAVLAPAASAHGVTLA